MQQSRCQLYTYLVVVEDRRQKATKKAQADFFAEPNN